MRSFVVCIVLAGSALASASWVPGVPQDTPEVAAAKAAHLAVLAGASAGGHAPAASWGAPAAQWGASAGAWQGAEDDGQWRDDSHQYANGWNGDNDGQWRDDTHQWNHGASWGEDDGQWRGDNSGAWNGDSGASWGGAGVWTGHGSGAWNAGTLINGETPEVAAARAAHLAAHAAAASGHSAAAHPRWRRSLLAVNPNALPVPLDTAIVAATKNAQLIQQNTEGTRNILGGGIPLALPADTHEVAIGKQAHAIAHASQRALVGHGVVASAPLAVAAAAPLAVAAPIVRAAPVALAAPAIASPLIAGHGLVSPQLAVAAPVAVARVVPAAALRWDTQVVSPHVVGLRPTPLASHGAHW